jgi:hypothetical protein
MAAIDATASLQDLTAARHPWDEQAELDWSNQIKGVSATHSSARTLHAYGWGDVTAH